MTSFRKKKIPEATRRSVAARAGGKPLTTTETTCHYCGAPGTIHWITPSWVHFRGLELDHVIPELHGGEGTPSNLVLACQPCNRAKGHKIGWKGALAT